MFVLALLTYDEFLSALGATGAETRGIHVPRTCTAHAGTLASQPLPWEPLVLGIQLAFPATHNAGTQAFQVTQGTQVNMVVWGYMAICHYSEFNHPMIPIQYKAQRTQVCKDD